MVYVQVVLLVLVQDLVDLGDWVEIGQLVILQKLIKLGSLDLTLAISQGRDLISWEVRIDDLGQQ